MRLEPHAAGAWVLDGVTRGTRPLAYLLDGQNRLLIRGLLPGRSVTRDEPRYRSHFASCVSARDWSAQP